MTDPILTSVHAGNSYDALPYDGGVAPYSLPAQMAAATLLLGGRVVTPLAGPVRVLELGCGVGTNLLSIASIDPRCDGVGVDGSATQIRIAQQRSERLGLTRLRWLTADLRDLDAHALGQFDFIVCHGVLSWVGVDVQQALLRTIATHLAPFGTALVSFNVQPGWGLGLALREGLLRMVSREATPQQQVAGARKTFNLMAEAADVSHLGQLVRQHLAAMASYPDDYLFHEYLEANNTPFWFQDFARLAQANGLRWIGEANLSAAAARLPLNVRRHLDTLADPIEREQTRDILTMNTFRYALCQRLDASAQEPNPPAAAPTALGRDVRDTRDVRPLWFAADLQAPAHTSWALHEPMRFETPAGYSLQAVFPIAKAACLELAQRWSARVSFAELLAAAISRLKTAGLAASDADAGRLGGFLYAAAHNGCVQAYAWPRPSANTARTHPPQAWPLARLLAAEGARVVPTALHDHVVLTDDQRSLLLRCDGQTPLPELCAAAWPPSGDGTPAEILDRWQRLGLIS